MGIFDTLKQNYDNFFRKEVRTFSASDLTPDNKLPAIPWLYHSEYGVPIRADVLTLRALAKSSWVQMVENTISKQVLQTEWTITVADETEDLEQYQADIDRITTFLNYPNRNNQTFAEVWSMFLRDVLEIDRGIIVKGYAPNGELAELFPADGSRFLTKLDKYGIIEGYYQYSFYSPQGKPIFFEKNEVVSGTLNISTERFPYGFSPLQSVQQEVELLINSTRYNKDFYKNNAIPDAIGVFDTDEDGMRRINLEWDQNVRGKAHKMLMTNAKNFDLKVLRMNNRDMEWLEGQKWYHHAVFGAYGLSPQEVGFYESSNRATSDGQERTSIRNAVKPYMKLIADKINREIIPDLIGNDNLIFKWEPKNVAEEQQAHAQDMDLIDRGILTIDEYRASVGMEALEVSDNNEEEVAEPEAEPQEEVAQEVEEQEKLFQPIDQADAIVKWEAQMEKRAKVSDFINKWKDNLQ